MLNIVMSKLTELGNERTLNKYIKEGLDVEAYGVKIGDLKKLIRELQLNGDNNLAIELMETKNYDAMYLAFLILKPSSVNKELFIKWIDYSTFFRIRINSLAYGMAEHDDHQYFLDYLKQIDDDIHQSMYYAVLAGRLIINPEFNQTLVVEEATKVSKLICSEKYKTYPWTRKEMNSLIGYIGMQCADRQGLMIELYNSYKEELNSMYPKIKYANQANFIESCINSGIIGKKRKKARC